MRNNNIEIDEYRKYIQFVNSELVRIKAKDFDGEAIFEDLLKKERSFQTYMVSSALWPLVCDAFFTQFNLDNMLQAKMFFRERVGIHKPIFDAIRTKDKEKLNKFKFNFMFFQYMREVAGGKFKVRAEKMFTEMEALRSELAVNALPIAVARGKMFYDKTPKGQLSLMDCISIANAGILKGLDKYDGTNGFRGAKTTAIIRMRGYLIREYSATWLTLYPVEQKILYRCRSIMGKNKLNIKNIAEITKIINEMFENDIKEGSNAKPTILEEAYLYELLTSSNNGPTTGMDNGDGRGYIESFQNVADASKDISKNHEDNEEMKKVIKSVEYLTKKERKIIRLMGVNV